MRPTRLKLFAVFALAGLASFATPALAGPGDGPRGHGARFEKVLSTLGLDAAQKEKVEAILESAKPQREAMHAKMRESWQGMRTLLEQENPDQAAVLSRADEIGQLKTEMLKERFKTMLAVRAELTPDQRAKLKAEMMKHGGGRWRHHRGGEEGAGGAPPEPPPED